MGRVAINAFAVLAFYAVDYLLWVMASGAFLNLWGCSCDVPARQKYHRTRKQGDIQQHEKLPSHLPGLPLFVSILMPVPATTVTTSLSP